MIELIKINRRIWKRFVDLVAVSWYFETLLFSEHGYAQSLRFHTQVFYLDGHLLNSLDDVDSINVSLVSLKSLLVQLTASHIFPGSFFLTKQWTYLNNTTCFRFANTLLFLSKLHKTHLLKKDKINKTRN